TTQLVGHPAAHDHDAVEILAADFGDGGIGLAGVSVFAAVCCTGFFACDGDSGAGLLEAEFRIPQLQIFIVVAHEDQDAAGSWRRHGRPQVPEKYAATKPAMSVPSAAPSAV